MTESMVLNLSEWTRIEEVDEYAAWRNISRDNAIRELVNSGLSHWRR